MNMNDEELLREFAVARNLKDTTKESYKIYLKEYSTFNQKTIQELLTEAESEEEQGIRWKHRKLKQRLLKYRTYLYSKHAPSTAKTRISKLMSFYKHYEIEIHQLPPFNNKNNQETHISFKDLPDKDIIKKALKIANPLMRAMILFMSSSGYARRETLNLTIADFIEATKQYHNSEDIYEALNQLSKLDNVIPSFYLKRQKTNKFYTTFCSPEAVEEIINYLLSLDYTLEPSQKLFKVNNRHFYVYFTEINERLNLGTVGHHKRFRSHMLRKFHASQLYNDGMSLEDVDSLQGRGKDSTHSSYFMDDPKKLKKKYIEHLDVLTINLDVNNINIKSPEFVKLEAENREKDEKIENYEKLIEDIDGRLQSLEKRSSVEVRSYDDLWK